MKVKSSVFLFLFVVVFTGVSSLAPARVYGQSGSSVWKISKDGNTVFLGGSIHILRNEDFPLPEEFNRAFEESSILVLEANIDELSEPGVLQYLMQRMILPEGKTLQSVLNSEVYDLLKEKCAEYGIPAESVSRLKPSMVVMIISVAEIAKHGFVEQGVDAFYFEKAKETKMPVEFLETVETQINILVAMGDGYENDFVKYSLEDMDTSLNDLLAMISAWKTGASEYTDSDLAEMQEEWPVFYKILVLDRNHAWLPLLEAYLTTEPVEFIIAGVAHMHGPDGLLRLLEDRGCTVEQLK